MEAGSGAIISLCFLFSCVVTAHFLKGLNLNTPNFLPRYLRCVLSLGFLDSQCYNEQTLPEVPEGKEGPSVDHRSISV